MNGDDRMIYEELEMPICEEATIKLRHAERLTWSLCLDPAGRNLPCIDVKGCQGRWSEPPHPEPPSPWQKDLGLTTNIRAEGILEIFCLLCWFPTSTSSPPIQPTNQLGQFRTCERNKRYPPYNHNASRKKLSCDTICKTSSKPRNALYQSSFVACFERIWWMMI